MTEETLEQRCERLESRQEELLDLLRRWHNPKRRTSTLKIDTSLAVDDINHTYPWDDGEREKLPWHLAGLVILGIVVSTVLTCWAAGIIR